VLAGFIVELTSPPNMKMEESSGWFLLVDGASNFQLNGASVVL